uniref:Uncharacterized protein n=1 Tax=Serinus canaria TaxID=9135 RepID=A0A8C9U9J5_SERCA
MPQPVASATKPNLLMAVAITVPIAKRNSARAAEEECPCGPTRYGALRLEQQASPKLRKSSRNRDGFHRFNLVCRLCEC